jgi:ribosome modulation factor
MFRDMPADAVVTWERHLAYGAALGVSGRSVKELPFGAEHDRRAWTNYGGSWRQVRVRYPILRPGWGKSPLLAALISLAVLAGALGVLWLANELGLLRSSAYGADAPWWTALLPPAIATLVLAPIVWATIGLAWATTDLGGTKRLEGEVVRVRARGGDDEGRKRFYVAVYTGHGDVVDALRVSPKEYPSFRQGEVVTLEITPRLGHVRLPA